MRDIIIYTHLAAFVKGEYDMQYYQRLRDLREDKDLNQEDIAKIILTSQSYYAQYENGKRELPFSRAIELAKFYNVSLDYIAGLIQTPERLDRFKK